MHLHSEFEQSLAEICDLDLKISSYLAQNEIDAEEITALVDTREQLLQKLLLLIGQNAELAKSAQWQQAIRGTQEIVELMQTKTNDIGLSLRKYQHGKRSVQQYQKFI